MPSSQLLRRLELGQPILGNRTDFRGLAVVEPGHWGGAPEETPVISNAVIS